MINFTKSILFCEPGSYSILGVNVRFENIHQTAFPSGSAGVYVGKDENFLLSAIKKAARECFTSYTFQCLSLGYLHIFVHEMGHALTNRLFSKSNKPPSIIISRAQGGVTSYARIEPDSPARRSLISAAGSLTNMLFSGALLISAEAFRTFALIPALILGTGSFLWMTGELLYAQTSAKHLDGGDFGQIALESPLHLLAAQTALVGLYTLSIAGAIALL
jgi:hypothetical protein